HRAGARVCLQSSLTRRSSDLVDRIDRAGAVRQQRRRRKPVRSGVAAVAGVDLAEQRAVLEIHDIEHGPVVVAAVAVAEYRDPRADRKSTRLNSSHVKISYAVF